MVKKTLLLVGLVSIISFGFLGMEHLLYSLTGSWALYPAYLLFLVVVAIVTHLLYVFAPYTRITSTLVVLAAIGLSLLALRHLVTERLPS